MGWHEPYSVPEGPRAEVFTNYPLIAGSPEGRAEGHLHGGHMFFLFVWGVFLAICTLFCTLEKVTFLKGLVSFVSNKGFFLPMLN